MAGLKIAYYRAFITVLQVSHLKIQTKEPALLIFNQSNLWKPQELPKTQAIHSWVGDAQGAEAAAEWKSTISFSCYFLIGMVT